MLILTVCYSWGECCYDAGHVPSVVWSQTLWRRANTGLKTVTRNNGLLTPTSSLYGNIYILCSLLLCCFVVCLWYICHIWVLGLKCTQIHLLILAVYKSFAYYLHVLFKLIYFLLVALEFSLKIGRPFHFKARCCKRRMNLTLVFCVHFVL